MKCDRVLRIVFALKEKERKRSLFSLYLSSDMVLESSLMMMMMMIMMILTGYVVHMEKMRTIQNFTQKSSGRDATWGFWRMRIPCLYV
jgi:hypothetical protein